MLWNGIKRQTIYYFIYLFTYLISISFICAIMHSIGLHCKQGFCGVLRGSLGVRGLLGFKTIVIKKDCIKMDLNYVESYVFMLYEPMV